MKQTTIPVKPDARVMVKCSDDLSVEGNESSVLVVVVDQGDSLRMKEENGLFRIVSDSDCRLLLPASVTVTIEKTGGDCHLSNLTGRVIVGKVGDDLKMEKIGGASIESVGSDCWIQEASGAIEIARIGDSLKADNIQAILANSVGCDVKLTNIHGKVEVSAGDEVSIHAVDPNVPEIQAKAGSDLTLYLSKDANCQLKMFSGGQSISIHAGGQDAELEENEFSLPIGEGGSTVVISAGDSIHVSDHESPDWEDEKIEWDEDRWKNFGIDFDLQINENLKNVGETVNRAIKRAEFAGRHASQQVEHTFRILGEHGFSPNRQRKVVGFSISDDKTPPTPQKNGPTDEERMLVLKMLQEKKISVEEAEKLLNALDR